MAENNSQFLTFDVNFRRSLQRKRTPYVVFMSARLLSAPKYFDRFFEILTPGTFTESCRTIPIFRHIDSLKKSTLRKVINEPFHVCYKC
jgi:hypothetical protein